MATLIYLTLTLFCGGMLLCLFAYSRLNQRRDQAARENMKDWLREQWERDQLIYLLDLYKQRQQLEAR